ncbi:hypothetical protein M9Y10_008409 [Tritrichomonas musculus]|uniref:Uncharacterized protein n=1 Tax=Tritrichomonas musculus TaxID=1915356 RepID=A0ABR2IZ17_9EUKA
MLSKHMKNHIYKLISALLLGSSVSVAIASAPKDQPNQTYLSESSELYDDLRVSLENLYGGDELGRALVDKFIQLLKKSSLDAIEPELVTTWFIFQLASIPARERSQYFSECIEELNNNGLCNDEEDGDSFDKDRTKAIIDMLQKIQERIEKREISWSHVERLRQLNLQPNGLEEGAEEAYPTGELD